MIQSPPVPPQLLESDIAASHPESSETPPVRQEPGAGFSHRGFRIGAVIGWLGSRQPLTLVALLAIVTMGPLILLSTLSVNSTYATLSQAAIQRLTDSSALAAVYVNREMTGLTSLADSYARRHSVIDALRDGNHTNFDKVVLLAALQDLRGLQSDTRFASFVDASGAYWGDQDPPGTTAQLGQSFAYRDWFQGVARSGKAYVSSAYVSAALGTPLVIAISDPVKADGVYAPQGTVVGILVVGYELSATQHLFSDFARDQGVSIEVTDQQGVIVAQSGVLPVKLIRDFSSGTMDALLGRDTSDRLTIGGEDHFAAYTAVPGIGWTVVAYQPAAIALADANQLRNLVIVITVALLAILAAAKVAIFLVLRDRQAAHQQLAVANVNLESRVAARTAELEASNRELEGFSYSVSHDLRTPLRSIDGFSRLVLDENRSRLSAQSVRWLDLVRSGAQEMGKLIDDLLSFSRLGRVELKKRKVDTVSVVNDVVAELVRDTPDRQIDFVVHGLSSCNADPILLKQVFRNLLANAVKFTGGRSPARIEIGSLTGKGTGKVDLVTYFVKDNGVGFDMRYSDKLFGVFQRLHRVEDFPGTGVGLALVKRIVERHGGTVWSESAVDAGATFYLTLEVAR